jgi:branched-chain amino acid transport system ATP-binding protein
VSQPIFKVEDLRVSYGEICALKGLNFEVYPGEIVALIGANGAGKTTTLRALSGITEAKGSILYLGKIIVKLPPEQRVALGISQAPEGRGIFAQMSVLENLQLGAHLRRDSKGIKQDLERCFEFFPRLKDRIGQMAGTLSGGEQQMLAICRCLMAKPKVMLLDEPSMGLAPLIVSQIFKIIQTLNQEEGMTIFLVEQNARMALKISQRAYVLEVGKIVLTGSGEDLLNNQQVQSAYLGL